MVEHDTGYAPNPYGGICTLVQCKYSKGNRRNIIEMAEEGDWIIGTGGKGKRSAGLGKIVYLMRVDKKIPLSRYTTEPAYQGREDQRPMDNIANRYALISSSYFYFGQNSLPIRMLPQSLIGHPIEKKGPGYRKDFTEAFISSLISWFSKTYKKGVYGRPSYDTRADERLRHKCDKK